MESPFRNNQTMTPGNKVTYTPLSCVILLDENYENYLHLHKWMLSFIDKNDFRVLLKDIYIHILTANKQPILLFKFIGCFPSNLSGMEYVSSVDDNSPLTFNVDFQYQYSTYERPSNSTI